MADIHFHIWLYKRDTDGIIRSMERAEEQFDTRRKANYGLEVFRRQRSLAGQVVQCVDGAFCKPPPDWVVKGYTLAGPREFKAEYFIEDTPSIRPSRKLFLGMESLERYANEHPEDVIQRPLDDREMREPEVTMASRSTNEPKKWPRDSCTGPGGGLYTGPGGGAYTGPDGGAYTGPDGGAYTGPGGGAYTGLGGGLSTGPGVAASPPARVAVSPPARRGPLHRPGWWSLHRPRRRPLHRPGWQTYTHISQQYTSKEGVLRATADAGLPSPVQETQSRLGSLSWAGVPTIPWSESRRPGKRRL